MTDGLCHARYGGLVRPVRHTLWVNSDKADAVQGEADRLAVAVDEAFALEGMAYDGQLRRPRTVEGPEVKDGKEHVRIRIQGPLLAGYPRRCSTALWQDFKVRISGG